MSSSYWKGWPNKCPYVDDLNWASAKSIAYLRAIAPIYKSNGRVGIVIFDLDDTLFMGDPEDGVGITEMSLGLHPNPNLGGTEQEVFILPVNNPIKKIAVVAKELGFKVICLTARPSESHLASLANIKMFDIPHDCLIMNDKDKDPSFKVAVRRQLAAKPNQDVVCTVGDQFTDVIFPGSKTCAIKLPDPDSKCSYAYIPAIPGK
jgi:hypothetical protein